jgi:hypothetical protein
LYKTSKFCLTPEKFEIVCKYLLNLLSICMVFRKRAFYANMNPWLHSLTFVHTKWTKFMPTFIKTLNKICRQRSKDVLNSTFWSWPNFAPSHLVQEQNLLPRTNIAVVMLSVAANCVWSIIQTDFRVLRCLNLSLQKSAK